MARSQASYKCSSRSLRDDRKCGRVAISTIRIEEFVADAVQSLIIKGDPIALSGEGRTEMAAEAGRVAELEALEARAEAGPRMFVRGEIDESVLRAIQYEAEQFRRDLERSGNEWRRKRDERRALVPIIDAWDASSVEERARAVRTLIDRIVVDPSPGGRRSGSVFNPDRLDIRWKQ